MEGDTQGEKPHRSPGGMERERSLQSIVIHYDGTKALMFSSRYKYTILVTFLITPVSWIMNVTRSLALTTQVSKRIGEMIIIATSG